VAGNRDCTYVRGMVFFSLALSQLSHIVWRTAPTIHLYLLLLVVVLGSSLGLGVLFAGMTSCTMYWRLRHVNNAGGMFL
jgi:hypothetical protein